MYCKYCGKEIEESNFCPNCGHKLEEKLTEEEQLIEQEQPAEEKQVGEVDQPAVEDEPIEEISELNIKNNSAVEDSKTNSYNSPSNIGGSKNIKKVLNKSKWLYIVIGVAIYLAISFFTNNNITDDDYISCAQTAISKELTAPSTASFSDGEVIDKDKYGRAIVTITVDAQNGFGAYIRNRYAVVINSYDKKTGEFLYNRQNIIDLENSEFLDNITEEFLKTQSNWDEPIDDD